MTRPRIGITVMKARRDLAHLGDHLDEVERLGAEAAELPFYDLDLVVAGRPIAGQVRLLEQACAGRGLAYTVHGPHPANFFDEPFRSERHFEVMKACLEAAAAVGAVHYVVHTGFCPKTSAEALEDAYARQRDWLHRAGDLAKTLGLAICVENVFDWEWGKLDTASPSRLAREIAAIGHDSVRATLDFGHAHLEAGFRGGDVLEEMKALAPFARHLHIHDNLGRPDDIYMYTDGERLAYGHGDLHLPVGWGSVPWDEIVARCTFPADAVLNIELDPRYWHAARECVAATRALAERMTLA